MEEDRRDFFIKPPNPTHKKAMSWTTCASLGSPFKVCKLSLNLFTPHVVSELCARSSAHRPATPTELPPDSRHRVLDVFFTRASQIVCLQCVCLSWVHRS